MELSNMDIVLNEIFTSCDPDNTGQAEIAKIIEYITPFLQTKLSELTVLKEKMSTNQNNSIITKESFTCAMREWSTTLTDRLDDGLDNSLTNKSLDLLDVSNRSNKCFTGFTSTPRNSLGHQLIVGFIEAGNLNVSVNSARGDNLNKTFLEERVKELEHLNRKMSDDIQHNKIEEQQYDDQIESLKHDLDGMTQKYHISQAMIESFQKGCKDGDEVREAVLKVEILTNKLKRVEIDKDKEISQLKEACNELEGEKVLFEGEIAEFKKQITDRNGKISKLENIISEKSSMLVSKDMEMEKLECDNGELRLNIDEMKNIIETLKYEQVDYKKKIYKSLSTNEKLQQSLGEYQHNNNTSPLVITDPTTPTKHTKHIPFIPPFKTGKFDFYNVNSPQIVKSPRKKRMSSTLSIGHQQHFDKSLLYTTAQSFSPLMPTTTPTTVTSNNAVTASVTDCNDGNNCNDGNDCNGCNNCNGGDGGNVVTGQLVVNRVLAAVINNDSLVTSSPEPSPPPMFVMNRTFDSSTIVTHNTSLDPFEMSCEDEAKFRFMDPKSPRKSLLAEIKESTIQEDGEYNYLLEDPNCCKQYKENLFNENEQLTKRIEDLEVTIKTYKNMENSLYSLNTELQSKYDNHEEEVVLKLGALAGKIESIIEKNTTLISVFTNLDEQNNELEEKNAELLSKISEEYTLHSNDLESLNSELEETRSDFKRASSVLMKMDLEMKEMIGVNLALKKSSDQSLECLVNFETIEISVSVLKKRLSELVEFETGAKNKIEELNGDLDKLKRSDDKYKCDYDRYKREIKKLQSEVSEKSFFERKLFEMKEKFEKELQKCEDFKVEVERLTDELECNTKIYDDRKELKNKLQAIEVENGLIKSKCESLQSELTELVDREKLFMVTEDNLRRDYELKNENLQREISDLRVEFTILKQCEIDLNALQSQTGIDHQRTCQNLEYNITNLEKQLKERVDELVSVKSCTQNRDEYQRNCQNLEYKIANLEKELTIREKELVSVKKLQKCTSCSSTESLVMCCICVKQLTTKLESAPQNKNPDNSLSELNGSFRRRENFGRMSVKLEKLQDRLDRKQSELDFNQSQIGRLQETIHTRDRQITCLNVEMDSAKCLMRNDRFLLGDCIRRFVARWRGELENITEADRLLDFVEDDYDNNEENEGGNRSPRSEFLSFLRSLRRTISLSTDVFRVITDLKEEFDFPIVSNSNIPSNSHSPQIDTFRLRPPILVHDSPDSPSLNVLFFNSEENNNTLQRHREDFVSTGENEQNDDSNSILAVENLSLIKTVNKSTNTDSTCLVKYCNEMSTQTISLQSRNWRLTYGLTSALVLAFIVFAFLAKDCNTNQYPWTMLTWEDIFNVIFTTTYQNGRPI